MELLPQHPFHREVAARQRTRNLFQLPEVVARLDDVLLMGLVELQRKLIHTNQKRLPNHAQYSNASEQGSFVKP